MKTKKEYYTTLGIRVSIKALTDLFHDLVMTIDSGYPDKNALISVYPGGEFNDATTLGIITKDCEYLEYLSEAFDDLGIAHKTGSNFDDEDGVYVYDLEVPMAGFVEVFLNGFNKFWRGSKKSE